jgi:arsenate reductase
VKEKAFGGEGMDKQVAVYGYNKCGTCRKAVKWLEEHGYRIDFVPVLEQPPSAAQLTDWIRRSGLETKAFFNVSGEAYRALGLKDRLPAMSDEERIRLLASDGKLIKRPVVTDGNRVTVGFKPEQFEQIWG